MQGIGSSSTSQPGFKFVDVLFATIIFEYATASRTNPTEPRPGDPKYVLTTLNGLAGCFRIAEVHCNSRALEEQLRQAGLSREENVEKYLTTTLEPNPIYTVRSHDDVDDDDDDNGSFSKRELVRSTQGLLVPIAGELDASWFNRVYENILPEHQDTIAHIIYKVRTIMWGITGHTLSESVVQYSSVYHKNTRKLAVNARNEPKAPMAPRAPRAPKAPKPKSVRTTFIIQKMQGLVIVPGDKKTYNLRGECVLDVVEPVSGAYEKISAAMKVLHQRLAPSQDYMDKREALTQRLERILNIAFPDSDIHLRPFGSFASGLGSKGGDADLCITSPTFHLTAPYNEMRRVATAMTRAGMTKVQAIPDARVPIVKFVDPQSKINCDINSNHVLGIYNSELIRCYTLIDDRVKPLIYNIKALAKAHDINDSSKSYLSSYSYVMMTIGFLQAQNPPILPVLQGQPEEYMTPLAVSLDHNGKDGNGQIDCTYDQNPARHRNFGAANTKSIGQLLIEFFEFYTRFFDYKTMEVNIRLGGGVRTRDEILDAIATGKKLPENGKGPIRLVVMDPFLRARNVSQGCRGDKLTMVWEIFEALYLMLSHGEFDATFEPLPGFQANQIGPLRRRTAPSATAANGTTPRKEGKQVNRGGMGKESISPAAARPSVSTSAPPSVTGSTNAQTVAKGRVRGPATVVTSNATGATTSLSTASTSQQAKPNERYQRRAKAKQQQQNTQTTGATTPSSPVVTNNGMAQPLKQQTQRTQRPQRPQRTQQLNG
ncbi:hypothetical protein B0O80DRAFT_42735 [Mortierella sp. GBAus27b]|nr:hypothetical protein B0O80DRAFT_42735 [Mortierella sp. GBAus27b]